jgi:hypothetical protein
MNCAARAAVQRDPLTGERDAERLSLPKPGRYCDRVPEVWVYAYAPNVTDLFGREPPVLSAGRIVLRSIGQYGWRWLTVQVRALEFTGRH